MSGIAQTATPVGSDVRFGSKADIRSAKRHVRFTPESRHVQCDRPCRLWAKSGHIGVGEIARSLAGNTRRGRYRTLSALTKFFFGAFLARLSQNAKEKLTALRTLW